MAMDKGIPLVDQLIDAIGVDATEVLLRGFGGKIMRIPYGRGTAGVFTDWLVNNIGQVATQALIGRFGGERLALPKDQATLLASRNALIVEDYDAGMSMIELVRKYDRTERQIRTIIGRPVLKIDRKPVVDDRQLGLF